VNGLLSDPLTSQERELLCWYLEEYWKWPYDEFARRGKQVEGLLADLGKRLYRAIGSGLEANNIVQAWRLQPNTERQISIVSEQPAVLSLPWELLHDEQGFLVLRTRQPVAILRRLPQRELAAFPTPFEPPLRVLLITARPENAGFVDPRGIARELLDELQNPVELQSVELEFLRPPTLAALRRRLGDPKHLPIHVLHFDGHGTFEAGAEANKERLGNGDWRGQLAFEDDKGELDAVSAETLAQVLQDSGVKLAVLTACQSALGRADDAFSSVAAQLIRSGVDAVAAMSASVLVASATRYVGAFYRTLTAGQPAPAAQERARQALHDDPRRHVHRRRRDEEGQLVELRDWWLPHFYQQRALTLQPTGRKRKKQRSAPLPIRLSTTIPDPPRYAFGGRARELLQIERWLLRGKLVVVHGFGGVGKTALVREAADWLTRTGMYATAYLHSFEHGGDAVALLSALGRYFGVYDGAYDPTDPKVALNALRPALRARPLLLITDNVESILSGGDTALDLQARAQLWNGLLALVDTGVGVLLTSRDTNFGDGRMAGGQQVAYLPLVGLHPEDAYALASRLLDDLNINRRRAPYAALRDLLVQLDHHPLAIQLVLPALRDYTLESIRDDFVALLPRFADDVETGRNRSLLASLDYSLRRLTGAQRALLLRLTPFEGGALEIGIPPVTRISKTEWATLRVALEQAALIMPEQMHETMDCTFLRFHPVLIPFLRGQRDLDTNEETALNVQYINWYYIMATASEGAKKESVGDEQRVTTLLHCEMPNFMRTLKLLVERRDLERASKMGEHVGRWLDRWGWNRERDELQQWLEKAITTPGDTGEEVLTERGWQLEHNRAQNEMARNNFDVAQARYMALLARIEAMSEGEALGPGSYVHFHTLYELASSLQVSGQLASAERRIREALALLDGFIIDRPDKQESYLTWKSNFLSSLGDILLLQNNYKQAKAAYEYALKGRRQDSDVRGKARLQAQLGSVALGERDYEGARARFTEALTLFQSWGDRTSEAVTWHQLGRVAQDQKLWAEAERCYRESLAIKEEQGYLADAASTYCNLALVAKGAGRRTEAEGWHRRAMGLSGLPAPLQATMRTNFVDFLLEEVQAGRATRDRLVEAREIAEQALAIQETLDTAPNIWRTLGHLATIAEMEGQSDTARDYRRREREASAASNEVRQVVDDRLGKVIALTAAAIVQANAEGHGPFEEALKLFDLFGDTLNQVPPVLRRIWEGERDWHTLAERLNRIEAVVVLRVLETISQLSAASMTPEQLFASLPSAIRDALTSGDEGAVKRTLQALSPLEQRAIAAAFKHYESDKFLLDRLKPLFRAIAEVALGNNARRGEIERVLIGIKKRDSQLLLVVRRIWAGERDEAALTAGLDELGTAVVRRVLEIITQFTEELTPLLERVEPLIRYIVSVALGDSSRRAVIESILTDLEKNSSQLPAVVRRIWAGERDEAALTAGLDIRHIALVRRVLEILAPPSQALNALLEAIEPQLQAIASVATGDDSQRGEIEELLTGMEKEGLQIREAVHRIWAGERDEAVLTRVLDIPSATLIRRVLEILALPTEPPTMTPERVLASLPPTLRDAYQRKDEAALQYAMLFRSPEQKQAISDAITYLNEQEHQANMAPIIEASVPILEAIAEVAVGRDSLRTKIEDLLPDLEAKGFRIRDAVHRIWTGERDANALTEGLNELETVLVVKVLEFIQIMPLLLKIAAVALHDETYRSEIETALPGLETKGFRIREAVHRIWTGERDADVLTAGLNKMSARFVVQILEYINGVLKQFEPFLHTVATVAMGDDTHRNVVEALLARLEEGRQLQEAVHRIWAGERDAGTLTEKLNKFDSSLVVRMLEYISKMPAPTQGAELPSGPN
jgi:tetratricopeptide (TPR) repeat protein